MKIKLIILFLFCVLTLKTIIAQDTIFICQNTEIYDVSYYSAFFVDKTKKIEIEDIINHSNKYKFEELKNSVPNFGANNDVVWIKFVLKNNTTDEKYLILEVNLPTANTVELYEIKNNKIISIQTGGIDNIYLKSDLNTFTPSFEIIIPPDSTKVFYIKVHTISIKILPVKLYTPVKFFEEKQKKSIFHFILLGIILASFFFNLILFFLTKERVYLYLSLGLFFAASFYAFYYGLFFYVDLKIPVFLRVRLRIVSYSLTSLFIIIFTILYLETKRNFKLSHYFLWFCVCFFIIYTISAFIPSVSLLLLNKITLINYPLIAIIQLIIGIVCYMRKH